MAHKTGLGRGLDALFSSGDEIDTNEKSSASAGITEIPVDEIRANPRQPRLIRSLESLQLDELAASIKEHGVIQPLIVTRTQGPGAPFTLIAGERRWRASQVAGLSHVPVIIKDVSPQEMLEIALIENIQREDLNAIEIAIHFRRLLDECNLTHESLADRLGKDRSTVTNFLRLLKLPPDVQRGLKEKRISMGHARALITLEDPIAQIAVYKEAVEKHLSVREVEALVRTYQPKKQNATDKKPSTLSYEVRKVQDALSSHLATRVVIKKGTQGKGEIVISFFSDDDLFRLKEIIEG